MIWVTHICRIKRNLKINIDNDSYKKIKNVGDIKACKNSSKLLNDVELSVHNFKTNLAISKKD